MEDLIRIDGLHFSRGDRTIFSGVDLAVPRGSIVAIMGPSGTGKTTLLQLIGGQLRPDQGSVEVAGEKIHALGQTALYHLRRKMGMLFQTGGLFTHLDVFENVAFPLREHTRLSESMIRTLVLLRLQMVGLRGARHLMPQELSGGMARRVALARAIALDPELVMYDEPFTGQDPISMGVLVRLIRTLNDALGLTSVIVSHDVPETLSIADQVYVLSEGKIAGSGSPREIMQADAASLRQFLHGLPDGPVPFDFPARDLVQDLTDRRHETACSQTR